MMATTESPVPSRSFLGISANQALIGLAEDCSRQGGYSIKWAGSGALGFKALLASRPDLVFLDISLPDIDGLSWLGMLREMKEGKNIPVIVAAEKISPESLAKSFELGAEDCVLFRHCDPREFSARIRAVLRRRAPAAAPPAEVLKLGPVELDPGRHRCFAAGAEVRLRPREFELLEMLLRKAGRVLSRPYLLESVWGMASAADTRAVDVTVSRLRKALGKDPGRWVQSVEKFGYRFADPDVTGS